MPKTTNAATTLPQNYQPDANLLQGKIIVVTGAGDGIGKAAALAYAKHGATVVLCGRTTEKLEAVYDTIETNGWPQAAIAPIDFLSADENTYKELATMLAEHFPHIDGLLNNASMLGKRTPIETAATSQWQDVIHTNVNAPFMLTKALLPLIKKAPTASIIFTSSGVGRKGRAYWGAYAVSKFATEGLMEVLADELGNISEIRSNCINPGPTNTAMRRTAYPAEEPSHNPNPEDIMPLYLWLMSDESKAVNGCSLDAQG